MLYALLLLGKIKWKVDSRYAMLRIFVQLGHNKDCLQVLQATHFTLNLLVSIHHFLEKKKKLVSTIW